MSDHQNQAQDLSDRLAQCREEQRDKLAVFDQRLLTLEIVVRGEDGRNGMKSQLTALCSKFDAFEKKAIRVIAIGTALPVIIVAVVAVRRFVGKV